MFDDFDDFDDLDAAAAADAAETVAADALLPPRQRTEVLGFDVIEKQLLQAFNDDRLPHAIILAGPEGIGKATFAFRIARFLLKHGNAAVADAGPSLFGDPLPATKPVSFEVAADDPVARQVASGGHADLLTIERLFDEKKGKLQAGITVEEARRITPFLRLTAGQGGWRVVIIDDADTMPRHNAQNAILKILEEPPLRTFLILIAHNIGGLLPTIRSRCRTVICRPPDAATFSQLLRAAQPSLADSEISTLYAITAGSVGQALRLQNEGGLEAAAKLTALLEDWPRWNWPEIHALAEGLSRPEQEDSYRAFQEIFLWTLEAMVRAKAEGQSLPATLKNTAAARIVAQYPLSSLLEICETLRTHFDATDHANLDRRQAVLGAFSILSARKAA